MDETPLRNGWGFLLALGPPSCRSPFGAQTAPSFVQSFVLRQRPPLSRWPKSLLRKEAPTGVEPVMEVLQTSALPLGYGAVAANIRERGA